MRPLSAHWPLLELDRWTISIIDSLTVSHLLALWVLLYSISSIPSLVQMKGTAIFCLCTMIVLLYVTILLHGVCICAITRHRVRRILKRFFDTKEAITMKMAPSVHAYSHVPSSLGRSARPHRRHPPASVLTNRPYFLSFSLLIRTVLVGSS